jgi:hypothetical protein
MRISIAAFFAVMDLMTLVSAEEAGAEESALLEAADSEVFTEETAAELVGAAEVTDDVSVLGLQPTRAKTAPKEQISDRAFIFFIGITLLS